MNFGLVGTKQGMSRVFTEEGESIPVTVIEVAANRITQVKTIENDNYQAVQVTTGTRRPSTVSKPIAGHFANANSLVGEGLWEFRTPNLSDDEMKALEPGSEISLEQFQDVSEVDVTGISIGKGFAGAVKRWNFSTQDHSHGNSLSHRALGSTGQCQTPGKVFKGKKMAGQLGNRQTTTQNLKVVDVDAERQLMLVKGAVPGVKGAHVIIRPATKKQH